MLWTHDLWKNEYNISPKFNLIFGSNIVYTVHKKLAKYNIKDLKNLNINSDRREMKKIFYHYLY